MAIALFACASEKKPVESKESSAPKPEVVEETSGNFTTTNRIGSDIIAKVVSIVEPKQLENPSTTCEKVACTAYLEVERLESVGRFFDYSFAEGDKIGAYFTFSLAKTTKELFPNSEVDYPGLSEGDRIKAYILIQSPVSGFPYTVDHYEILP